MATKIELLNQLQENLSQIDKYLSENLIYSTNTTTYLEIEKITADCDPPVTFEQSKIDLLKLPKALSKYTLAKLGYYWHCVLTKDLPQFYVGYHSIPTQTIQARKLYRLLEEHKSIEKEIERMEKPLNQALGFVEKALCKADKISHKDYLYDRLNPIFKELPPYFYEEYDPIDGRKLNNLMEIKSKFIEEISSSDHALSMDFCVQSLCQFFVPRYIQALEKCFAFKKFGEKTPIKVQADNLDFSGLHYDEENFCILKEIGARVAPRLASRYNPYIRVL